MTVLLKDATREQLLELFTGLTSNVNKIDELVDLELLEWPISTAQQVVIYGGQRYINDATAGKEGADARKALEARLEKMKAGTCAERSSRESDPVKAEMKAQATKAVSALIRDHAKKNNLKAEELLKSSLVSNTEAYLKKYETRLRDAATKIVAERKAAKGSADDFVLEGLE